MSNITLTKLGGARSQLRTAIELWFADGDPASIHTLACAAYQIVHDLNERQKGPREKLLLDLETIKPEYRKMVRDAIKEPGNFLKHGKRGKAGNKASIEFNPELTVFFIAYTLKGLVYLKQDLSVEEIAFNLWQQFHRSELFMESWQELLNNRLDPKTVAGIRALPKNGFLQYVQKVLSKDPASFRW